MSKDTPTIREFANQSEQSSDTARVVLDHPTVQVVDEDDLPDSSTPTEKGGSSPLVVEVKWDNGDLVYKRTYVEDPSEVPEGVSLREGSRDGLFYDDSGQEFVAGQHERTKKRLQDMDVSDELVNEAVEVIQKHDNIAQESFEMVWDMANDVGADIQSGSHRVKGVGSAVQKVAEAQEEAGEDEEPKYDSVSDLTDVHGSQVVVDDLDDAEEMYENFLDRDDIEVEKAKDHTESTDDPYRAHHVVIEKEDGVYTEIQIKEERMSEIASASHSLVYKAEDEAPVEDMETVDEENTREIESGDVTFTEEFQDDIEDCLTQQADLSQGLIEDDQLDCDPDAAKAIREYLEMSGYIET